MSRREPRLQKPLSDGDALPLWRSVEEQSLSAEARAHAAAVEPEVGVQGLLKEGVSRRGFLLSGGVSAAAMGLSACIRRPEERFAPYARAPEQLTPGTPEHYATVMTSDGDVQPVIVETHGARPTKIEGNPQHPWSRGGTSVQTQAAIMDLYDPDRLQKARIAKAPVGRNEFLKSVAELGAKYRAARGAGLGIVVAPSASPAAATLLTRLKQLMPEAATLRFSPVDDLKILEGTALAFGTRRRPVLSLASARVVVCVASDLVGTEWGAVRNAKALASRRKLQSASTVPPRVYAVDAAPNATTAYADHATTTSPRQVSLALLRIAQRLQETHGLALGMSASAAAAAKGASLAWADAAADDLFAHRGHSLLSTGRCLDEWAHALCAQINQQLGNLGKTVSYPEAVAVDATSFLLSTSQTSDADIRAVKDWVLLDVDPVGTRSRSTVLQDALRSPDLRVWAASSMATETAAVAHGLCPLSHALESWGDALLPDGTYAVQQPVIGRLWESVSALEVLAKLVDDKRDERALVMASARSLLGNASFDVYAMRKLLRDGVANASLKFAADAPKADAVSSALAAAIPALSSDKAPASSLEAVFVPDAKLMSGRSGNNPWLLELPDTLSKIAWGNAALLSPTDAKALSLSDGSVVALAVGGLRVEAPVAIQPGVAVGTVVLPLGWGLQNGGRYGDRVGTNFFALRASDASWSAALTIESLAKREKLARTQTHHSMEGRPIAIDATLDEYKKHPDFASYRAVEFSSGPLWKEVEYKGHKWGMVIDLNACTGCNVCTIACQAENNIPVVGKKELARGREMYWIRVDRYFVGADTDQPEVALQPVACQHCELAPCENVCPVNATVHSPEGTNDMAYNRCIGTRYCMNNCPYKVRRFNYLDWHGSDPSGSVPETKKLQFNPDVSVRMRGVMEKCTYCIQRIERGKKQAKLEKRPLRDGDIVTACAQACPSDAIVFGDLNDPHSRVHRAAVTDRGYALLAEIGTKPRTRYLARIRNVNPALGRAAKSKTEAQHG